MDLVQEEFLQRLDFYQHSWLPARALVEEALAQRFQVNLIADGQVVSGRSHFSPKHSHTLHFPFRWIQVVR